MYATMLSTSPGVQFKVPFLYTKRGETSPLRHLLPPVTHWFKGGARSPGFLPAHTKLPRRLDCMNAINHQRIDVLFTCMDACFFPCDPPRVIKMEYCGANDMSMGYFLENYCLQRIQKCCSNPQCGQGMLCSVYVARKYTEVLTWAPDVVALAGIAYVDRQSVLVRYAYTVDTCVGVVLVDLCLLTVHWNA